MLLDPIAREKLLTKWKAYLVASLLCTVTLIVSFLVLSMDDQIVIASLGATAFVVFAMPKSRAAETTRTIGGHAIGLLCGSLASLIPHAGHASTAMVYGLGVGVTCFLMLVTRYKHPPAAGTALGITATGMSISTTLTVVFSVILISFIRIATLNALQDFSADD